MRRHVLPRLQQFLFVGGHVGLHLCRAQFVGLGEHNGKGNAGKAEPIDELKVNGLRFQTHVDQHEDVHQLLAPQDVAANHLVEPGNLSLRALGKAIARQVDKVPLLINNKVVDQKCLSGSCRCLCQLPVVRQHIDKTRLADIASSDESILGLSVFGTLRYCLR